MGVNFVKSPSLLSAGIVRRGPHFGPQVTEVKRSIHRWSSFHGYQVKAWNLDGFIDGLLFDGFIDGLLFDGFIGFKLFVVSSSGSMDGLAFTTIISLPCSRTRPEALKGLQPCPEASLPPVERKGMT